MNPIFKREFLARWRDRRSHLLLLALALLLGIAAYWSYAIALGETIYATNAQSLTARSSHAGHALFSTLAIGNVGAWFILSPLLLATGVARERERGLLESLQLSPMRPTSQIVARVLSALSFLAILQCVTLPIYFVAFSFGGVSQGEILRVWVIVAAAAFCGVGLGLALSALSPRPSGALFGAVALLVVWSLISTLGSNFTYWLWFVGWGRWAAPLSSAMYFAHPLMLVASICDPRGMGAAPWMKVSGEVAMPWSVLAWGVVGLVALAKATRDVTRPLPPSGWAGRNTLIQKWKERREARLRAQSERRRSKVSVEGALLADLPFDKLIRFKNPLLNREVKSRFRLRRASAWVWMGRTVIFLGGAGLWIMVFFSVFLDPTGRPAAVPMVLWGEWLLGTALVGTFAASAFAREREAGTWEGLRLSLLSPGEVTRTKWLSPLVAFAFLSCPLWLFLLILTPIGSWNGVPFRWIALGALLVIASLCWVSALGSWISVRAKSTATATCWTIGVLLVVFALLPGVDANFQVSQRLALWHKGLPVDMELDMLRPDSPEYTALYTRQTGIKVIYPYGLNPMTITPDMQRKWERYSRWFYSTNEDVRNSRQILSWWNFIEVLESLDSRGRRNDMYGYSVSDVGSTVTRVWLHIVLAFLGTVVFLFAIHHQLKTQPE